MDQYTLYLHLAWPMGVLNITMHTVVAIQSMNADPTGQQRSRSLRQGQRQNQGHTMTLHTYNPTRMFLPSINFLHLTVSEIWPGQDFIGQGHYSKVKSRSHHDVAHLHPLTNVPTKNQLPTPYSFPNIAQTRF